MARPTRRAHRRGQAGHARPAYVRLLAFATRIAGLLTLVCAAHGASAQEPLEVEVGSHVLVQRTPVIERVAVGDPDIADIEPVSERELLVLGKSPGTTSLILWTGQQPEHLSIVVTGGSARAGGALGVPGEPDLRSSAKGGLEGLARSLPGLALARERQAQRDPGPDATQLDFETQVQIDIKVVEVSRQLLRQVGINFLRSTRGSAHALSPPGALAGISSQNTGATTRFEGLQFRSTSGFLPLANAFQLVAANTHSGFAGIVSLLEANGFAQTLAEPSLVTTSGQTASFLAGGEFPIPVVQGDDGGITIEYREFGVRLTLRPTVLSPEQIVVKVAPEVSDLDFSAGISVGGVAVPALRTRRAETTVELGDGESFVIGGLISRNLSGTAERVPGLANLPVLGALFRRSSFQRDDRELLMIVSPHLVRPLSAEQPTPPLPGSETLDFEPSNAELIFQGRATPPRPGGTGFAP